MVGQKTSLALLLAFFCCGFSGDKAKNFALPNLQNEQVELKALLKKGPVLIDFWATWCKPCIKAFPELEAIHQKYKNEGLTVVGINTDSPRMRERVEPFIKNLKVTFPILIDENGDVMMQFRVMALPTPFLISLDRNILATNVGYLPLQMRKLDEMIASLADKQKDE